MHHNRKSLIKALLIKICVIIILLNITLTVIFTSGTIKVQRECDQTQREYLREEIIEITDLMRSSISSTEKLFHYIHKDILSNVKANARLQSMDLANFLTDKGLSLHNHTLNIYKNGLIVNSNDKSQIGKNVFIESPELEARFNKLITSGEFTHAPCGIDTVNIKLKQHSFTKSSDSKYLIEISSTSGIADEIWSMPEKQLRKAIAGNKSMIYANLWFKNNSRNGLLKDPLPMHVDRKLIESIFQTKEDLQVTSHEKHTIYFTDYMYIQLGKEYAPYDEIVISLLLDGTHRKNQVKSIITKQALYTLIFLIILLAVFFIATKDLRIIVRDFLKKTTSIANGALNERIQEVGNHEFTTLAEHFNNMLDKLELSHKQLSIKNEQIEESNKALSQQNEEIKSQRDEIEAQRDEIDTQRNYAVEQKEFIEKQQKDLVQSIAYAKRIQEAALPHPAYINEILPDNFILFKPRNIVSGDFYWVRQINQHIVVVAADSTGHGVPGAIMSILGISLLNEIVQHHKVTQPNLILNDLRKQIKRSLRQSGVSNEAKDGMDIALCTINTETNTMQYAGAFNPLLIVRNKEIIEYKADRMPVGIHFKEKPTFSNHEIQIEPGDTFYIFSDGFPDQIGGPNEKKFKTKNFKQLLVDINENSMVEQKNILERTLRDWTGDYIQIDDILVMGFRYL